MSMLSPKIVSFVKSLVRLFRKRGDFSMVGEASYSDSTPERIAFTQADLLLLDCLNPNQKSDDLICDLRESLPQIRVVLFGMDEDADISCKPSDSASMDTC